MTRRISAASVVVAIAGGALAIAAIAATQAWLDRHFLPSFFLPRRWFVAIYAIVRVSILLFGLALVARARSVAVRLTALSWPAVHVAIAAALALVAGEFVLERTSIRTGSWFLPAEEPLRTIDVKLGWRFVPDRTGHAVVDGRSVEYALDRNGYRVRRAGDLVDVQAPTVVCVGESMMFGEGLSWEESVPAQLGMMLGVQSANLAVHGYSTAQAFLKLRSDLPRFRQPVAVVTLFMSALFGRNLDDDRPHLSPGLRWNPTTEHARLVTLAGWLVPYRRTETIDEGIAVTRETLHAIAMLARERGAAALVVVPQFGPEAHIERTLRQRVFEGANVDYVFVEIDDAWRLAWDRHPNARAARLIATAIAGRLCDRVTSDGRLVSPHPFDMCGVTTDRSSVGPSK
jgi:hypothetical protein